MKQENIWCDICKKEMGKRITWSVYSNPIQTLDSGFYNDGKTHQDVCQSCLDRINKVINEEIEKIKKELK